MTSVGEFLIAPTSDHEAWLTGVRSLGYSSCESGVFRGSIRASSMWGIPGVDVAYASPSFSRAERPQRQIRLDGKDYYKALFQISGRSTLIQNDRVTELAAGGCGFVDMARPSSFIPHNMSCRWLTMFMPRRTLSSHLGLEPSGGTCWHGAISANRLLFRLVSDALSEGDTSFAAAEPHMQLAIYDLLGALLAVSDLPPNSSYTDKVFTRVCNIAKSHFSDPEITLRDLAGEAGISVRYLQKLFTARGTTCSGFIQALRLEHAARLLRHRKLIKSGQPLTEIAYACGYRDYAHFSQLFRLRFGCTPSAASEKHISGEQDIGHRSEVA